METTKKVSTVSNKYPTYRDDYIRGCFSWLEGKRVDDNAEKLWRVHDKLYDLTEFIGRHPGGSNWIELTKGTDVTDQFETFHLSTKASSILPKYYVRDATKPRNYKLTYDENGFYKTLKKRVVAKLKDVDEAPMGWSKFYFNIVLIAVIVVAILSARSVNWYVAFGLATLNGLFITWFTIITHNFIHQKNNWRMYMMNITLMNWRDWRVFHAMSHHMYPNSYHDLEVTLYEPGMKWIPENKTKIEIVYAWLIGSPLMYIFTYFGGFYLKMTGLLKSKSKVIFWDDVIPLVLPLTMLLFVDLTIYNLAKVIALWLFIIGAASFMYSLVAVNAGHHGPANVHEGDEVLSLDFGIFQLGATIDRKEADSNQFMVLTHFGEHILHHMFPSLDHGLLPQLKDTFIETCKDFDVEMRQQSFYEALVGQFQQLGRTETVSLNNNNNNNNNKKNKNE
ncbi:unnamed protein product [Diamesa hyperborea]